MARSLKCFPSFYLLLAGQWRHSLNTGKLSATLQIAKRLYALAQEQNDSSRLIGACAALACTLLFLGDFETSGQYAIRGVQLSRSLSTGACGLENAAVSVLWYKALFEAHIGEVTSSRATMAEAISLEEVLKDMYSLAMALNVAAYLGEAIRIAKEQKSVSLEKRAEATFAEYRPKKRPEQEVVDSDYLFANLLQRSAFRSIKQNQIADV